MPLVKVYTVPDLTERFGNIEKYDPGVLMGVEAVLDVFDKQQHLQRSFVSASECKLNVEDYPAILHLVIETSQ